MKTPEEIREILITSCQKMQYEGWAFINTTFLDANVKRCCPVMAIALAKGWDPQNYNGGDGPDGWVPIVIEAIGQESLIYSSEDSWNHLWQGYDGTAEDNREKPLYKIGREIRPLFPTYWEK